MKKFLTILFLALAFNSQAQLSVSTSGDQVITSAFANVYSTYTTDVGHSISSFLWTKVSGRGTIVSPTSQNTGITSLRDGVNIFQITVTQDDAKTASATISITVSGVNDTVHVSINSATTINNADSLGKQPSSYYLNTTTGYTKSKTDSIKPQYVADISALQAYTGAATTVIVQDTLRGGIFSYVPNATVDNGTVFTRTAGGYWKRVFRGAVNSSWYGGLSAAITGIGSNTVLLDISGSETLSSNLTIPSNISLEILKGGSINVPSGDTLLINGTFKAGRYTVFAGSGIINFGSGSIDAQFPEWDGATSNDANANATNAAFQKEYSRGLPISLGKGTYQITGIVANGSYPLIIYGQPGSYNSQLHLQSGSGVAITIGTTTAVNYSILKDFNILGSSTNTGGILLGSDSGHAGFTTIENVIVEYISGVGAYGIEMYQVQELTVRNCRFTGNYNNVWNPNSSAISTSTVFEGKDSHIGYAVNKGVLIEGMFTDISFKNIVFESNQNESIYYNYASASGTVSVKNCYFEGNNTSAAGIADLYFKGGSLNTTRAVVDISECYFSTSAGGKPFLYLENTRASRVSDCFGIGAYGGMTCGANTQCRFENNSAGAVSAAQLKAQYQTMNTNSAGVNAIDYYSDGSRYQIGNNRTEMQVGFGANTMSGILDWNDSTNRLPGVPNVLLKGTALNGPGDTSYYHPLNFEYSTKNGTGNITQFAIPYSNLLGSIHYRGYYNGAWSAWKTFSDSANVVHTTGDEFINGTKTINNAFQVTNGKVIYWGNNLNGQMTWDASNMIINTLNGKLLKFQTNFNDALTLDGNGNGTFRGSIKSQQAFDSSMTPILGQIYPSQKKWVIFGDSFSATDIRYYGTVRDKLKFTGIVTNAVSGNKISQQSAILDSILTANPTYFNSFDICSIWIGINDFAGASPLGTLSDTAGQPTYAGYLKHMIEKILTAKPNIELYVMTPPEGNGAGVTYKSTNAAGWTVRQMSILISQICASYSVQCIDLYNLSQFNLKTIPTLTDDGLHPSTAGSAFLGNIVANAFVNRHNEGSFVATYPDIPSGAIANGTTATTQATTDSTNKIQTTAGSHQLNAAIQAQLGAKRDTSYRDTTGLETPIIYDSIAKKLKIDSTGTLKIAHIQGFASSAPTITVGGSFTGTATVSGTDLGGEITFSISASTSYATLDPLVTLTFHNAYGTTPYVTFSPSNSASGASGIFGGVYVSTTTTGFSLNTVGSGTSTTTTYKWAYHVNQ